MPSRLLDAPACYSVTAFGWSTSASRGLGAFMLSSVVLFWSVELAAKNLAPSEGTGSAVVVGDILGIEHNLHTNLLLIYATKPSRSSRVVLRYDELVRIALASNLSWSFSLERESANQRPRYFPAESEDRLRAILGGSTVEATLVNTTVLFRRLACRSEISGVLGIERRELETCRVRLCETKERAEDGLRLWFTLDPVKVTSDMTLNGEVLRFDDTRLAANFSLGDKLGAMSDCVANFGRAVKSLTEYLLADDAAAVGMEFRRLRSFMVLSVALRALGSAQLLSGTPTRALEARLTDSRTDAVVSVSELALSNRSLVRIAMGEPSALALWRNRAGTSLPALISGDAKQASIDAERKMLERSRGKLESLKRELDDLAARARKAGVQP